MLVALAIVFLARRRRISGFLRLVLRGAPPMAVVIRHGQIGVTCEERQLAVCRDSGGGFSRLLEVGESKFEARVLGAPTWRGSREGCHQVKTRLTTKKAQQGNAASPYRGRALLVWMLEVSSFGGDGSAGRGRRQCLLSRRRRGGLGKRVRRGCGSPANGMLEIVEVGRGRYEIIHRSCAGLISQVWGIWSWRTGGKNLGA